jgi:hypothetical protein
MFGRQLGSEWQKTLWKILINPMFEVAAAVLVVSVAACVVVETQMELRHDRHRLPLLVGPK